MASRKYENDTSIKFYPILTYSSGQELALPVKRVGLPGRLALSIFKVNI